MDKAIDGMTLGVLLFLLIGCLVSPNNPLLWLAGATPALNLLRVILIVIITATLLYPFSGHLFGRALGVISIGLAAFTLIATYQNYLQLWDTLSLLAASTALGLTALEQSYQPAYERQTRLIDMSWLSFAFKYQMAVYTLVAFVLLQQLAAYLPVGNSRLNPQSSSPSRHKAHTPPRKVLA
jgi:hypothetical protein